MVLTKDLNKILDRKNLFHSGYYNTTVGTLKINAVFTFNKIKKMTKICKGKWGVYL